MNRMVNKEPCGGELIPGRRNIEAEEYRVCSVNEKCSGLAKAKAMCRRLMGECWKERSVST